MKVDVKRSNSRTPCTRCGGELLITVKTPKQMGNLLLELCPACDGDKPAAGAFIRWLQAGEGAKEMTQERVAEMGRLNEAWLVEAMREHGWGYVKTPAPSPN